MKVRSEQQEDNLGVCHKNCGTGLSMVPLSLHCLWQRLRRHSNPSRGLLCLVFLFITATLQAFPQIKLDQQYIQYNFIANLDRGTEQFEDFNSFIYGNTLDFKGKINNFAAAQISQSSQDFTFSVDVWPSVCKVDSLNLTFGGKSTYHYLNFTGWSSEHDFLAEPFLKYTGKSDWHLMLSLGAEYKLTKINYFDIYIDELFFSFCIEAKKYFKNGLELYYLCANHDEYRYYVFPSPIFRHGLAFKINETVKIYGNWQIHCCDMFTSKFYLNGRQVASGVVIQL